MQLKIYFSVARLRVWCWLFFVLFLLPLLSDLSNVPLGLTSTFGSPDIHPFIWVTLRTLYLKLFNHYASVSIYSQFPIFFLCEKISSIGLTTFSSFICRLSQEPLTYGLWGSPQRPEGHFHKLAVASGWRIQWCLANGSPHTVTIDMCACIWDFLKPWIHGQVVVLIIGYGCWERCYWVNEDCKLWMCYQTNIKPPLVSWQKML